MSTIDWPTLDSEFEVQAELYLRLRHEGVLVRGNVFGYGEDANGGFTCFLDLVVFNRLHNPVAIVECKNRHKDNGTGTIIFRRNTRQSKRYQTFGLPVFQCLCMKHVNAVEHAVMELLSQSIAA